MFRFAPKFVKHLHQPVISMRVRSCTSFSHFTWTGVCGRSPQRFANFGDLLPK